MNPAVKQQWIQALRSDAYKQVTGTLHDDEGFCCLGVLCDLHAKETGKTWCESYAIVLSDTSNPVHKYSYLGLSRLLPPDVQEWAGLTSPYGANLQHVGQGKGSMLHLNDDYRLPFPVLADLIEEQL